MADRFLTPKPGDPVALVLALCHEAGNLLAAARLSAYLVARETERDEVVAGAGDIESVAAQAGAVLAHIRPLLLRETTRLHVDPGELLEAARRSVEQQSPRAPRVEFRPAEELPDVRVDPDALHHLLVTLVLAAWDASSPEDGGVRVHASTDGAAVVFVVEDRGRPYEDEKVDPQVGPRGRGLALEVAATLLAGWDGEVRVVSDGDGTRVELRLPAAVD